MVLLKSNSLFNEKKLGSKISAWPIRLLLLLLLLCSCIPLGRFQTSGTHSRFSMVGHTCTPLSYRGAVFWGGKCTLSVDVAWITGWPWSLKSWDSVIYSGEAPMRSQRSQRSTLAQVYLQIVSCELCIRSARHSNPFHSEFVKCQIHCRHSVNHSIEHN